jgi:glycosyltransferase involved in cell wall biosynthesis
MNTKVGYIPKEKRKKILLICDDIRAFSGVANIAREIVVNTCHHYDWVTLGGAITHPEKGKRLDLSADTNNLAGINDSSVIMYPTDGYGNPELLRAIIKLDKPDAIMLITDPRYFVWLFQMENELRKQIPIVYLNIWDSVPAPMYNKEFYESCDALLGISKQTVFINKNVLGSKAKNKIISYIPHGLNHKSFRPLSEEELSSKEYVEYKNNITKGKDYDFILFFNSRNIRRKSIPDTILAWKMFNDQLTEAEKKKCLFVLHTNAIDENGTDLPAVIEYLCSEENNVVIDESKASIDQMNWLYNMADGTILLTSNEGWGLSLTESMLAGTPIIANVTGGMQDQMRFEDEEGNWFTPDENIPSNHKGTFKKCGKWTIPVFPTNNSLVGSIPTPYIFDDKCQSEDAAKAIMELYKKSKDEKKEMSDAAREWATSDEAGFTAEKMSNRVIESIDELFSTWKPREKYELLRDTDYEPRTLKHKLVY